jgi:hypothetical protein
VKGIRVDSTAAFGGDGCGERGLTRVIAGRDGGDGVAMFAHRTSRRRHKDVETQAERFRVEIEVSLD